MSRVAASQGTVLGCVALLLGCCFVSSPSARAGSEALPVRQALDLQVPAPPTPVKIDGKLRLVYELQVTNFAAVTVALTRVSVSVAEQPGPLLDDFKDAALSAMIGPLGSQPASGRSVAPDVREILPGMRSVIYFWLSLDDAVPRVVDHRIEFDFLHAKQRDRSVVQGGATAVRSVLPPVRGGLWAAIYDPSIERGHRRMIYAVHGRARVPARFAIDWVKVDRDGKSTEGSRRNALADASGNYVVLDLGQGRYAFYEHLKPGSVAVKPGDRVRSGQVIAAVGYTGDPRTAMLLSALCLMPVTFPSHPVS